MTKEKVYQYTSSKGTVLTTIDLEMGNPKILYQLGAEKGKILTNGMIKVHYVTVPENEVNLWQEIKESSAEQNNQQGDLNDITVKYEQIIDILTGKEEVI